MKQIYRILVFFLAAVLAGCGQQPAAAFSESDLLLEVGGNPYRCRDNIQTVVARLGGDYGYAEGKSCNYDGLDKTFTFEDATFYTNPLPEGDMINEIYTESETVSTSKGISVGADMEEVLAAYGEPGIQEDSLLVYRAQEKNGQPSLCFALEGGTVASIYLTMEAV